MIETNSRERERESQGNPCEQHGVMMMMMMMMMINAESFLKRFICFGGFFCLFFFVLFFQIAKFYLFSKFFKTCLLRMTIFCLIGQLIFFFNKLVKGYFRSSDQGIVSIVRSFLLGTLTGTTTSIQSRPGITLSKETEQLLVGDYLKDIVVDNLVYRGNGWIYWLGFEMPQQKNVNRT